MKTFQSLMFLMFLFVTAVANAQPHLCSGYPELRVLQDAQSWWTPTGGNTSHIHVTGCIPEGQKIRGVVTLDLKLQQFRTNGTWGNVTVGLQNRTGVNVKKTLNWSCGDTLCEQDIIVSLDTTKTEDGWAMLQMFGIVGRADGIMLVDSRYSVYVDNGNLVKAGGQFGWVGATGWFEEADGTRHGYMNAGVWRTSYKQALAGVSGIWPLKMTIQNLAGHSTGFVSVDPHFHDGDPGFVVYDGPSGNNVTVNINTTQFPDGWHKLFVRGGNEGIHPRGVTNGVFVMPFLISNGVVIPTATPSFVGTPTPLPTLTPTPCIKRD